MIPDAGESMYWFCIDILMKLEEIIGQKWMVVTNFDFNNLF